MDIGKVGGNVVKITDYIATQKKEHSQQKKATEQDVIVDLNSSKTAKSSKPVTYSNLKNLSNAQLLENFSDFSNKQIGRQLGSIKAYIQGFIDASGTAPVDFEQLGQRLLERYDLDVNLDPATIEEGGKYSAENLSDTLVNFAKSISGGDASKANLLMDAVKKGFEEAGLAWGDKLPEISQRTYELTMEKFEAWKSSGT